MTGPHIDPEVLASFLDGTLPTEEREQVLRTISGSPAAYAEFSEAAALRDGLQADDRVTDIASGIPGTIQPAVTPLVVPLPVAATTRPSRSWSRLVVPATLLAAALTVVVLSREPSVTDDSTMSLARSMRVDGATGSGTLTRVLGAGWEEPGWANRRGSGQIDGQLPAHAFRLGVRYAQLEIAMGAGDTAAVFRVRDHLLELLRDTEGAAPLAREVERIGQPVSGGATVDAATLGTDLRGIVAQGEWFDLGAWTGAAQVAARAGQTRFFAADGEAVGALRRLLRAQATAPDQWRDVTRELAPLASGAWESAGGLTNLRRVLTTLAANAGR